MKLTADQIKIAQNPLDDLHRQEDELSQIEEGIETKEEELFSDLQEENTQLKEKLKGTMARVVKMAGVPGMQLEKGQRVNLTPAKQGGDHFATPINGRWSDGVRRASDDSILIRDEDVQTQREPRKQFLASRIAQPEDKSHFPTPESFTQDALPPLPEGERPPRRTLR